MQVVYLRCAIARAIQNRKHSDGLSVSSTVSAMITPSSDIATPIEHSREREGGAAKRNPQTTTAMADKQIRACSVLRSSPRTGSRSGLMTSGNDTEYRRLSDSGDRLQKSPTTMIIALYHTSWISRL